MKQKGVLTMKRTLALILALVLALGMVFVLAACKDKDTGGETTTEPTTQAEENTDEVTDPVDGPTEEPSSEEDTTGEPVTDDKGNTVEPSTKKGDPPTGTVTTTTPPAKIDAPVGGSVAQIVAFYNKAANDTKAAKNFTATRHNKLDCNLTEGVLKAANELLGDLRTDKTKTVTFVNGKGTGSDSGETTNKFLPPAGDVAHMSKLTAAGVASAKCEKKGTGWQITLKLKEEVHDAKKVPPHHGSCMDTLDVDWDGLPINVKEPMATYKGADIKAVVNKDGKLDSLYIYEPVAVRGSTVLGKLVVEGYWLQEITFKDYK